MKIVHLNTERGWRGGERQTFWLARELARRGHEIWAACRPGEPLETACRNAGLSVLGIKPFGEMDPFAAWWLARFLRARGECVLHAHTAHAVGLGALAVQAADFPFVATRRVDFPIHGNPLSRWKYRALDKLAVISNRIREVVAQSGFPAERLTVIPSGIDPEGYPLRSDRERLRREKGYGPRERLVVNAAALVPHKDHATLVAAAARLPDARFLVLGDGPLRNELRRQSKDLGVEARVDFLGHRKDVLDFIALADVFVLSSREEGLGTSLLDALTIGVPTVAARAGGIPELYGSPAAPELVPPRDPVALAEGIQAVLADPEEARRRVERGRERAKSFTVSVMTDRYEELYGEMLNVKSKM